MLIIGVLLIIAAIIAFAAIRIELIRYSKQIDYKISQEISNYAKHISSSYDDSREKVNTGKNVGFHGLKDLLERGYKDCFISGTEEDRISITFSDLFNKASSLRKKLDLFIIHPSERFLRLIDDYGSLHNHVKHHNERVTQSSLVNNQDFFDNCLTYPLDQQQRCSIISEEDNCLVVSSAGSGKTSSIVGKVKYLIERRGIDPNRILLISYTNKAAAELTERMAVNGLRGYTFHKLAIDIIGKKTGEKPTICDNTDALFVKIYHELLSNSKFRDAIISYFVDYQVYEKDWEKRQKAQRQNLSEQKNILIRSIVPDMDGNYFYVRSEQEQRICFALFSLGIKFRYEEPYEYRVSDEVHSQYKPDFSIYFEKDRKTRRIYLEHFGVDEHGLVPTWFAKDNRISYEEANKRYGDGITWKRATHKKFGTTLLCTSSADFHYSDIKNTLRTLFMNAAVPIEEKSEMDIYNMTVPENSMQEKAFIRLVVTFITLLKSNCKSFTEVLKNVYNERDKFIINNIFIPVYNKYVDILKHSGQIDFTDAILMATNICKMCHPVSYDYIIVDEFQDISMDRYRFLEALREGNSPAKLYCVGDDWQSIYRFSGSDMALFYRFSDYFGHTDIKKIETTYRFGEPMVSMSSQFIQQNKSQITKQIHPFNNKIRTELHFQSYERNNYCEVIRQLVASIPENKSIFLLGRYSFDDYYLSFKYQSVKDSNKFYYIIENRKIEFLTIHKAKGLEADYVIILMCNKDAYGFPSQLSDDPVLNYVLSQSDRYPYGEERRLFYVAITRAKVKTTILYDQRFPSVFVDEFLHPERVTSKDYVKHPNAHKKWTRGEDKFLLLLHTEGKSIKYIAEKMGRSQTSIVMRLGHLGVN